jgi:hypothetical protein
MRAMLMLMAIVASGIASPVYAQRGSRCAECHFANMTDVPSPAFLGDWDRSAHAREGVACDRCHGGNPWTDHPIEAHRGVLSAADRRSPIHPENLSATCASCHRDDAAAFGQSRHQALLADDDRRGPTCVTCHGAMRARRPSPIDLEAQCASCHTPGSRLGDYPAAMRASVEALDALRVRGERLASAVEQVSDPGHRLGLQLAIAGAHRTLTEAIAASHTFDVSKLSERNAAAREQLDAVAASLAATGR